MHRGALFIFFLVVEILLLVLALVFFLLAIAGALLPIVQGWIMFVLAAAIYTFILRSKKGIITPHLHTYFLKIRNKILALSITHKIMAILKKMKAKKEKLYRRQVIMLGITLFGLNLVLSGVIFMSISIISNFGDLIGASSWYYLISSSGIIFILGALCALTWFQVGVAMKSIFKSQPILKAGLVTVFSLLPLLVLLSMLATWYARSGSFPNETAAMIYLSILLTTVMAACFEVLIVLIGLISKR